MQKDLESKQCTKCLTVYGDATASFHKRKEGKNGLHSICKKCRNEYALILSRKHPEKVKEWSAKSRSKNKEKRNAATRAWFKSHPGYHTERYRSDRKKFAAKARQWRQNLPSDKKEEMLKKNRARCSKWRELDQSKDFMREYLKKYRLKNLDKINCFSRNYKARKRMAHGSHSGGDIWAILEKQERKCFWCSKELAKFHIDHVVPLSKGGSNSPSNLVAACPKCNISKKDRLPEEWPQNPKKANCPSNC